MTGILSVLAHLVLPYALVTKHKGVTDSAHTPEAAAPASVFVEHTSKGPVILTKRWSASS
jgi:hypothetical protein